MANGNSIFRRQLTFLLMNSLSFSIAMAFLPFIWSKTKKMCNFTSTAPTDNHKYVFNNLLRMTIFGILGFCETRELACLTTKTTLGFHCEVWTLHRKICSFESSFRPDVRQRAFHLKIVKHVPARTIRYTTHVSHNFDPFRLLSVHRMQGERTCRSNNNHFFRLMQTSEHSNVNISAFCQNIYIFFAFTRVHTPTHSRLFYFNAIMRQAKMRNYRECSQCIALNAR